MGGLKTIYVVSDIHYACDAEKQRGWTEYQVIDNPRVRSLVRLYRHVIWRRDPFAHNHLIDSFIEGAQDADYVVGNGDFSCDTGFVGISDSAALQSARECVDRLRGGFGDRLLLTVGDHELGKISMVGGKGGMRLDSWRRLEPDLGVAPFWERACGKYLLLGVTSSLIALPVFEPEILSEEWKAWCELRREHLELIRTALDHVKNSQKVILFCHDPTALPFLWSDDRIRSSLGKLEATVIGHLHSRLFLWNSRLLSGMPRLEFLGNSIRRMSSALSDARCWRHFHIQLCPALGGIELFKRGGYLRLALDLEGHGPVRFETVTVRNHPQARPGFKPQTKTS